MDRIPNTSSKEEVRRAIGRIINDNNGITSSSITQWDAAYSHVVTENALNGLVKCDGAGNYSVVADNSTDWNNTFDGLLVYDSELKCFYGTGGLGEGGPMVYPSAGIALSTGSLWGTSITNNSANWNTAYGWGNHASAGYLTSQTSHANVVVDGDFTSQGIMLRGATSGTYSIATNNTTNWNVAYGWGNHAGLYDTVGTAAAAVSTHQSTYNHTNYNTAYSWGNHASAGYLTTESVFLASVAYGITAEDIALWNTGGTSYPTAGLVLSTGSGWDTSVTNNSANWNTAYGWGNHASAGYLSAETDPVFTASVAASITQTDINNWNADGGMVYPGAGIPLSTGSAWGTSITNSSANWNTAYGWGNHASAGYVTAATETDPVFSASVAHGITADDINNWNAGGTGDPYTTVGPVNTTDSVTWVTLATIPITENSITTIDARVQSICTSDATKGSGGSAWVTCSNDAGTATLVGSVAYTYIARNPTNLAWQFVVSGANALLQVRGLTGLTVKWTGLYRKSSIV